MFPESEIFYFDGCVRNVVTNMSKKSLNDIVYTESNLIYLGRFVRSEALIWTNGETVTRGLAVFEHGCVMFPDYGSVKIYNGKELGFASIQSLFLYDVY